jgi:2-hydroxy-3-keto-5-methylthiopentenyl-1-phosphate phosphatase
MSYPKALVLDFDGTLTLVDVGDALCERFADPAWKAIDLLFESGKLSLPEAQKQMWGLFRASREVACAHALEIGRLRPGLDHLLDRAESLGYSLHLASGGFDFYVEAILGSERLRRFASIAVNTATFEGERMTPVFARSELGCERFAVCKGVACRPHVGPRSVFVGDGDSDSCALEVMPRVFAVRGRPLERIAAARSAKVTVFESLDEVAEGL